MRRPFGLHHPEPGSQECQEGEEGDLHAPSRPHGHRGARGQEEGRRQSRQLRRRKDPAHQSRGRQDGGERKKEAQSTGGSGNRRSEPAAGRQERHPKEVAVALDPLPRVEDPSAAGRQVLRVAEGDEGIVHRPEEMKGMEGQKPAQREENGPADPHGPGTHHGPALSPLTAASSSGPAPSGPVPPPRVRP